MAVSDRNYGIGRGLCAVSAVPGTDPAFLRYAVAAAVPNLVSVATGSTYQAVSIDEVANLSVCMPPLPEQRAIAAFLDRETARIDALVAAKLRLIKQLQQRRRSWISTAIGPGGAGRGSPMCRLRYCLAELDQGWSPVCESRPSDGSEYGVLKVGCVNGGIFRPEENKAMAPGMEPRPNLSVRRNDVLVSRGNTLDLVGSAALVDADYPTLFVSDLLYRLRPDPSLLSPAYLAFTLSSHPGRFQIERAAWGSSGSMPKISQQVLRDLILPLPPLDVQVGIVTRIRDGLRVADHAVAAINGQVRLLLERRQALVTAAVTGQIDIAEAAA